MPTIEPYHNTDDEKKAFTHRFMQWLELLREAIKPIPKFIQGDGSPEGVLTAPKFARYQNNTGTAGTLLYVKSTAGTLNTGWVAYA